MRKLVPTALGLYLAAMGAVRGQEGPTLNPAVPGNLALQVANSDQQLATIVAHCLKTNANLKDFRVGVGAENGVVDLVGSVTDLGQHAEVMRTAYAVPGVVRVRDLMTVLEGRGLMPVQAAAPGGGMPPEPLPIYTAQSGMPNPQMQPPPLPPNAWPTYAPYNNYSRVAYPKTYPYEAWPFIGPNYPFPKVPLGWRAVTLRWNDGYWWYGKEASGHDWWRIRYW